MSSEAPFFSSLPERGLVRSNLSKESGRKVEGQASVAGGGENSLLQYNFFSYSSSVLETVEVSKRPLRVRFFFLSP